MTQSPALSSVRRQARLCASKVIVPEGLRTGVWYDVCQGRRRDDHRPGMLLLDLGDSRLLVPEACVELREAPAAAPAARPRRRVLSRGALVALAASALPVMAAAVYTVGRVVGVREI